MHSVTNIAVAVIAIAFASLFATAVISLWKASIRDPDAPPANRKKKRDLPKHYPVTAPTPGGPKTRMVPGRRGGQCLGHEKPSPTSAASTR